MNEFKRLTAVSSVMLTLVLLGSVRAQPPGPGGGGFPNVDPQQMQNMVQQFRNMDPAQLQEMMQQFQNMDPQQMRGAAQQLLTMDPQQIQKTLEERENASMREEMDVPGDSDWSRIQERIKAVTKARAAVSTDTMGMLVGVLGGGLRGGRGGGAGFQGMATRLTPEAQALQAAIDANAPSSEIQNLMARLRDAREAKRATLVKAQEELRALLTPRQEAVAVSRGLLE